MTKIEREIFIGMIKDIPHNIVIDYLETVRDKNLHVKHQEFEIASKKRDQEKILTAKYPALYNLRDVIDYNNMDPFIREIKLDKILC